MNNPTTARAGNDTLTNVALGALVAGLALAGLLRAAAILAAHLTGRPSPEGNVVAGFRVLANPSGPAVVFEPPGLTAVAYWSVLAVLVLASWGIAVVGWRVFRPGAVRSDGFATRADVAKHASARALRKRSKYLRPSLGRRRRPEDVGYLLGRYQGRELWASVEDSFLVIGPPRMGKGEHIVINAILDAPGAVVTTSTRPDTLAVTLRARERRGPVAVFDPQRLAPGLTTGLRWSPIRGCEDEEVASLRARGLASTTGFGGHDTDNSGYWQGLTRNVLECLLHAAALGARSPADLYLWSKTPAAAQEAVAILAAHPDAAPRWAETLNAQVNADPRTRDSVWGGVSLALGSLNTRTVMDAVSPGPGEHFDPEAFLRAGGTLYLLATSAGSGGVAPLVGAFIEDITETAKRLAARSPMQRLDPPLLLALDEIGNLAPLPTLPALMSDGGGSNITVMPVLQSWAQARNAWGTEKAGAIWEAAIVKINLGGSAVARDLQDVSALLGERDDTTYSTSIGADGSKSTSASVRRVPVMSPQQLRAIPRGKALILLRSVAPMIADLRPWRSRKDRKQLLADQQDVEARLARGAVVDRVVSP
ncbi:Type IV secretory pathway VirD4 protein-like protein [Xylanimonas cellulosilytica DSM 15894]|uniref:Type IV secretory pathway VirD4 protein-like protein n=1 Tax=Xylanimonas cellulosilytica (strain DSM 15894 / JCM 12276 / CECT 5975 / KCTC 9989 / LMG 20990 / NBRC 107835 / XIL07) TaxID=446471 RepID=D1BSB3_XYLCX|nr:type IV secretory system conjugative DNA transfer family protein [Xylanimonas cellulosilytica]ACZ30605.1 Type IV secretory pathway VirD4 protein-like protein [Xylanimonas cellulosilytica DSM 15894]